MTRWLIAFIVVISLTLLLQEVTSGYKWVVYLAWLCSITQMFDAMHRLDESMR